MNTTKTNDNGEMYICEALCCIDYLLKYTDTENITGVSPILTYCKRHIGYEPRRQRIAKILNYLAEPESKDKTRRLGFVISAIQTGKDPARRKFYVSERLITMEEINSTSLALNNYVTSLTGSKRIDEIIEGLKLIYPTEFDKGHNLIDPDYLTPIKGKGIDKDIAEKICRAFIEKILVRYTLKDSTQTHYGRIERIFNRGGNQFDIKFIDDEFKQEAIVDIRNIAHVELILKENINFNYNHQMNGNLSLTNNKSINRYMTDIIRVGNYLSRPARNVNKEYITFKFNSLDIIKSFDKEFNMDLLSNLIGRKRLEEEQDDYYEPPIDPCLSKEEQDAILAKREIAHLKRHKYLNEIDQNIKSMIGHVYVSRPKFIKWASRSENILDIEVIKPFELNNEIRNRINYVNRLAQTKFNYITPKQEPFFEIKHRQNNEIIIEKIHGDAKIITIPDSIMGYPVTEIGRFACTNHCSLEKLIIGSNVKQIGYRAFSDCKKLNEIKFNEELESIGEHAFDGCDNLEYIHIEAKLKHLYPYAFANCNKLDSVEILNLEPNYLVVYNNAFEKCINLRFVDLAFLRFIGNAAFKYCDNIIAMSLRCSPEVVAEEFIDHPKYAIRVTYNQRFPETDRFKHLACYPYIKVDEEVDDWYANCNDE